MKAAQLHALGFDQSTQNGKYVRVNCSQCEASVINGVPCHERGCPNEVHECRGCNALVERGISYCKDCA